MEAAIVKSQNSVMVWDESKVKLLKDTICKGADENEFSLALQVIQRTGLDPFAGQIHFIKRWNTQLGREEMKPQVGIDGFRLIAQRNGHYSGQLGPLWCGTDGVWKDVWLDKEPPAAAKVAVLHADFKEPLWAVARFSTYLQLTREGKPKGLWGKGADLMIAKCAEALALRKAFPQELSGLYTSDEIDAIEERDITPPAKTATSEAQAAFEASKGIVSDQAGSYPPPPPEITPEQIAAAESETKRKELAKSRATRLSKMPADILDYFKAKRFNNGKIFGIMDENNDDPECIRAFMQDNPIEPVKVDDLAEYLKDERIPEAVVG